MKPNFPSTTHLDMYAIAVSMHYTYSILSSIILQILDLPFQSFNTDNDIKGEVGKQMQS